MNKKSRPSDCPSHNELDQFANDDLKQAVDEQVETHVEDCPKCQSYLAMSANQGTIFFEMIANRAQASVTTDFQKPVIEGYEIIGFHKAGGQGVLFKAKDLNLERIVAIKLLKNDGFHLPNEELTLVKEARTIAKLSHPNIVRLHGLSKSSRGPCMMMDWIEGGSLYDYLKSHRCTVAEIVALLIKICNALEYAHQAGVLHMDIKPSNILLRSGNIDEPLICDFGLAKSRRVSGDFSTTNIGTGTAGYMPPEMISSKYGKISQASDVYSMGALLYQLLTGNPPHQSENAFETLERTCDYDVIAPSYYQNNIAKDLETICLKCLRRNPLERYPSIKELKDDLTCFQQKKPIHAKRNTLQQKLRLWAVENPWIAGLSASLICVLCCSVVLLSVLLNRAIRSETEAERELARTVETFRLSSPLIKRFIGTAVLKPDEIKKIVNIANLLKDLGRNSHDLRQRFDLIYVGLELSSELKRISSQLELSERMTREARDSMKQLIDNHANELDKMAFQRNQDTIGISLLDQSLIRYGHSCIQLYETLQLKRESNASDGSEMFVDEAIATAEKVIRKNPDVDEAYSDLANYYLYKIAIWNKVKNYAQSFEVIKKQNLVAEKMMRTYPNDPIKVSYWIRSMRQRILIGIKLQNSESDVLNDLQQIEREMDQDYQKQDYLWPLTAYDFLSTALIKPGYDFSHGRILEANQRLDTLLKLCRELIQKEAGSKTIPDLFNRISVDQIAICQIQLNDQMKAGKKFDEMVEFWTNSKDDGQNRIRLATLYMLAPIPEKRSFPKASEILKTLDQEDATVKFLNGICSRMIQSRPLDIVFMDQGFIERADFEVLVAESYLNANKVDESDRLVSEIYDEPGRFEIQSIAGQIRIAELMSKSKSIKSHEATRNHLRNQ